MLFPRASAKKQFPISSMVTKRQILARWKSLIGYTAPGPWNEDQMDGYFQSFRPDGKGVEAVFEDVEYAEEILPRLMEVYSVTAEDFEPSDAYFVVREPAATSITAAKRLVKQHLDKTAEIARFQKDDELLAVLEPLPSIEVAKEPPEQADQDEIMLHVGDATSDFLLSLKPRKSHALLLHEALCSMASDCLLADYVLWPLYRETSPIEEPFQPAFEMWKRGIRFCFEDEKLIRVYGRGIGPAAKASKKRKAESVGKASEPAREEGKKAKRSAGWNLQSKLKELEDSPNRFDDDFYLKAIEKGLSNPDGYYVSITSELAGLAIPLFTRGAIGVLQEDVAGWEELLKGWRYRCWEYWVTAGRFDEELGKQLAAKKRDEKAFETLGTKMEDAALCLATAIALGQDDVAQWCGDRLIRNFSKKDPLNEERIWYSTAFEPFMVKLYARWRGIEKEVLKKGHRDLTAAPKDGVGPYQAVLDAWEDDRAFISAVEDWCDFHAERTADPRTSYRTVPYEVFPVDVVAAVRIRTELVGPPPELSHPVWDNPLAHVPDPLPKPQHDELLDRVIDRSLRQAPFLELPWKW